MDTNNKYTNCCKYEFDVNFGINEKLDSDICRIKTTLTLNEVPTQISRIFEFLKKNFKTFTQQCTL